MARMWAIVVLLFVGAVATAQTPPAGAGAGAHEGVPIEGAPVVPGPPPAPRVELRARNPEAKQVLNQALTDARYWSNASTTTYADKMFDEIRLKQLSTGYVTLISGEGDQDFQHQVVADIVFSQQNKIPLHSAGAKAVVTLGTGTDSFVGTPYTDTFFFLDFEAFYAVYSQRMYRETDTRGRTILWYEMLHESFVDPSTWARYQQTIEQTKAAVQTRWVLGSVVDVGDIFGMFIVEPGTVRESRVTFITKIVFGDDAGWVAKFGSQLPPVLRAGLKSGFKSCVELARAEQNRRGR
jgi:hypothetical protein